MLILSRQANQSVTMTGGIKVTVTEIRGGSVKLGFDAPKNVLIVRDDAGPDMRHDESKTIRVKSGETWSITESIDGRITIRNASGDVRFDGNRDSAVNHLAIALAAQERTE